MLKGLSISNSIEYIVLTDNEFGNEDAVNALCNLMQNGRSTLKKYELRFNEIYEEAGWKLLEALENSKHIVKFELSENKLGPGELKLNFQ